MADNSYKTSASVPIELVREDKTILLGYSIGSADLPHGRKLSIVASGKIIRFKIDGIAGYVDMDISSAAETACMLLTGEK